MGLINSGSGFIYDVNNDSSATIDLIKNHNRTLFIAQWHVYDDSDVSQEDNHKGSYSSILALLYVNI